MRLWILLGLLTCFSPSSSFQASYMLGPSNGFRERAQSFFRSMSNSMLSRSRGRRSGRSDFARSNSGSFAPTNWPDPESPTYPAASERRYHMTAQTPNYESPINTPNLPHWLDAFVSTLIRHNFGGWGQLRLVEDVHYVDPHTGRSYQRQTWVHTPSSNQPNGRERRGTAELSVYNPVQGEDSMTLERRPSYNGRTRRPPRALYLPFNPSPSPQGALYSPFNPSPSPQGTIPDGVPPGMLPFETVFRPCPQRPRGGNRPCEGGVCAMPQTQNNDPPDIPTNDDDPDACCICSSNKKNTQLEPCNHEVCMACTRRMKSEETRSKPFICPFCRQPVTGWHPKP